MPKPKNSLLAQSQIPTEELEASFKEYCDCQVLRAEKHYDIHQKYLETTGSYGQKVEFDQLPVLKKLQWLKLANVGKPKLAKEPLKLGDE